jgi:Protein of unknown function (DUF2778)
MGIGFAVGLQAEVPGISVLAATPPKGFQLAAAHEPQGPNNSRVQLASLETGFASGYAFGNTGLTPELAPSERVRESFSVFADPGSVSFEERFAAFTAPGPSQIAELAERPNSVSPTRPDQSPKYRLASLEFVPDPAKAAPSPPAAPAKKRVRTEAPKDSSSSPETDSRTAIYDISARTVYLPNGRTLEAHSGLGEHMDDARYVHLKARGPTPPNVYALSLREQPFHGVRAIRLTPVGGGDMFGRDGMLAHTYMLGANGQSNGCVSFSDYPAFLNAYLNGEIDRLVVVDHLSTAPSSQTASGWLPDLLRSIFIRS